MGEQSEIPKGVVPEADAAALTPEYAAKLLILAFRFAQGHQGLHKEIFGYTHAIRPEWRIEDTRPVFKEADQLANAYFFTDEPQPTTSVDTPAHSKVFPARNAPITKEHITMELSYQLDTMKTEFEKDEAKSPDEYLPLIVEKMIERDLYFAHKGRPRDIPDFNHVLSDPHASFLIEYAFRGKRTGVKEVDVMLSAVKDRIIQNSRSEADDSPWKKELEPKLMEVIDIYNKHHPDTKFVFPGKLPPVASEK